MSSFFVHGAIAWATIALISIPVIIHLINRRRYLRLDWAAMEFLLAALKRNRRKLRLEQLLLLLLRIALMALLGFLVARPILSDKGLAWLASAFRAEDKIFVLDDSFSMTRREAGRSSFQKATEALTGQIRQMADRGGADRLTVVRGSRARAPLVRGVFVDRERALGLSESIARLQPSDVRLPLAHALDSIVESGSQDADTAVARPRSISIITDLRAADWTAPQGGPDEELHRALLRVTSNEDSPTRLVVLDTGSDETGNVAIAEVTVEGGKAVQDIPVDLRVEVRNLGASTVGGLSLRVRQAIAPVVSGEESRFASSPGPPVADLAPGATGVYKVPCTFRSPGDYGVLVELAGVPDALPEDNVFPLVVEVVSGTDVLVVSGEPSSELYEGEADFLEQALAPAGDVATGVRPEVVVEETIPRASLEKYAMVFLLNVHSLPQDLVPQVDRYVANGGTLVVFPGDQVDGALYNRQLGPGRSASEPAEASGEASRSEGDAEVQPLLPGRLGDVVGDPDNPVGIRFALDHPYFRLFRDAEEIVGMIHFSRYFEVSPLATAQVLARLTDPDESPAIVEHAYGDGRVLLFAGPADDEWSDWPRNPTYLPVLQELVTAVVKSASQRTQPIAGSPLVIPTDIALFSQQARLRYPGYPNRPERVITAAPAPAGDEERPAESAAEFQFTIEDTHQSGLYALALQTTAGGDEWREIAIRRDPRESDLSRISATRLRELYPDVELTVIRDVRSFSDVGRGSFEISDFLLWLFLGLLFVEALLARLFAHHPSSARAAGGTAAPAPTVEARRGGAA